MKSRVWICSQSDLRSHFSPSCPYEFTLFSDLGSMKRDNNNELPAHLLIVAIADPSEVIRAFEIASKVPLLVIVPQSESVLDFQNRPNFDFLVRPLNHVELGFRAEKLLTRNAAPELCLDLKLFKAIRGGTQSESLTAKEFQVLVQLEMNIKKGLSRADLIESIWGGRAVSPGVVDVHLCNLRKKLNSLNVRILYDDEQQKYKLEFDSKRYSL